MTKHELEQCVREYGKDIYSFCKYLTPDPQEADDLYQDVFLTAVKRHDRINRADNPKSYLLSVALRVWNNRKRKYAWRRRIAGMEPLTEYTPSGDSGLSPSLPEECILEEETRRAVRQAVEELPEKLRVTVLLYYMEGLSTAGIAEVLKLPKGTVLSRLHQARQRLKTKLESVYDEEKS